MSLYAKEKVGIENFILENEWKFDFTILRFATAFGHSPRMRFDLTVNEFIKFFFLKLPFEVYDSNTWRPYCHTKDFARALEAVSSADTKNIARKIFNVGSNETISQKKYCINDK